MRQNELFLPQHASTFCFLKSPQGENQPGSLHSRVELGIEEQISFEEAKFYEVDEA